ncbi:TspO/MBR family protein [Virgibacillus halophilus]|uniref:TspO/MBR family protein n=1 Tax=Tigheibacillus halophilus TaxID=361280 RepID=A0ABU5CAT0_9BACI|nr:TspO/MBR family protein [Virgibacillus halophilus]
MPIKNNKWKLAASVALPVVAGTIAGTIATRSVKTTFRRLKTPKCAPPNWIFPVVWTSLDVT